MGKNKKWMQSQDCEFLNSSSDPKKNPNYSKGETFHVKVRLLAPKKNASEINLYMCLLDCLKKTSPPKCGEKRKTFDEICLSDSPSWFLMKKPHFHCILYTLENSGLEPKVMEVWFR